MEEVTDESIAIAGETEKILSLFLSVLVGLISTAPVVRYVCDDTVGSVCHPLIAMENGKFQWDFFQCRAEVTNFLSKKDKIFCLYSPDSMLWE